MIIQYVQWADATAVGSWVSEDDETVTVDICETIGYLVKETNDFISIAATRSEDKFNAIMNIPKPWIIRKEELICPKSV